MRDELKTSDLFKIISEASYQRLLYTCFFVLFISTLGYDLKTSTYM